MSRSRSSFRYALSARAAYGALRVRPAAPTQDILTPWAKRLVAGRHNLARACLTEPGQIARHMALDIAELSACAGCATTHDLTSLGWTAAQIATHGEAARVRVQADAVVTRKQQREPA